VCDGVGGAWPLLEEIDLSYNTVGDAGRREERRGHVSVYSSFFNNRHRITEILQWSMARFLSAMSPMDLPL
jgi:hypothetical protein